MKKILKEYESLISLTRNHDDWKSIDISRINLKKFLKKNEIKYLKENEISNSKENSDINIRNNNVNDIKKECPVLVIYDKKKSKKKIKKHSTINGKVENLNYFLSPYFTNIYIKNNTKKKDIIVINNIVEPKFSGIYHQRNIIRIGDNCQVSILEKFLYIGDNKYVSNIHSEIYLGNNSVVNYYCLKESKKNSIQIFNQRSYLQKNAKLSYFVFSYGKGIQNIKKVSNLINLKSRVDINSINYTNKKEKRAININVNHYIKSCFSNINAKGIFNSIKEGSIIGKINIKKNCSDSKAFFHSDNLLTMTNTKVNIRPILKIYNKDVKCSHGATIGFLGKDELFYLRSRGIDLKESQKILKHCFIKPSIDLIKLKYIKNTVKRILGITGIYI